MHDPQTISVVLCMGSSCFARGNNRNIELLHAFRDRADFPLDVQLRGHLCEGLCKTGPNIMIDGTLYREVDPVALTALLNAAVARRESRTQQGGEA
jgi:NADH:ubiquinone oxidoreductase subunit E